MTQNKNVEEYEGVVVEALPNTLFRVKITDSNKENREEVLAYISGKMRMYRIRILVGDKVRLEMPPGEGRGRITYRYK